MVKKQILRERPLFWVAWSGRNPARSQGREVSKPYLVNDLTGGAKRLMQTATGYTGTVAAG